MHLKLAISILSVPLLVLGCSRGGDEKPSDPGKIAEAQALLAASEKQAQLWKEAARGGAGGLEKLPVADRPVVLRQRVVVQDRKAEPQPRALPKDLAAGFLILSAPELPEGKFAGAVQVLQAEGERIDLDLGSRQILSLLVRAGGTALSLKTNDKVQLDYRTTGDPFDRRMIVALRTQNGDGFVSALESGRAPVEVQIPLFDLSAIQTGQTENGISSVEVRVGNDRKVLVQGQIAEFPASRLSVGLVASVAYTGAATDRTEGNPYAIRIVAWPLR